MPFNYETQIKEAINQFEEDESLPPMRVPPLSRKVLIHLLSELRNRNIKIEGNPSKQNALLGLPRNYSRKPLSELRRIPISEMYVRKTHEGRFLLCRIITPPTCIVSVLVGVEDQEGVVAQLGLYNYPGMTDTTHDNLDKLLPIGTLLALREPTYTYSISGNMPMVRVDAPSDVIFLSSDSSYLQNVSWSSDPELPLEQMKANSIDEWLTRGRNEYKLKHWLTAAVFFSEGLKVDSAHSPLRLNRALCYLQLGWYNAALADAEEVRNSNGDEESPLRLKASYRSAKAYYMLGNYTQAINHIQTYTGNEECKDLIRRAKQRLIEQRTGQYDWIPLFKESQNKISQLDLADYTGPIKVAANAKVGGGRGVFVTRDVEIGELLLVEKSLASCFDSDFRRNDVSFLGYDVTTYSELIRTYASLPHKVAERLWDNAKLDQTLKSMYAGTSLSPPQAWQTTSFFVQSRPLKHPLEPVVDVDITRIEAVCAFNAFGTSSITDRFSLSHAESGGATKTNDSAGTGEGYGAMLFGLTAMINHACQGNALWYTLGDAIVVRSTRALKKGEEVTHSYHSLNRLHPYASRAKHLSKWEISCDCLLCTADRADGDAACAKKIVNKDDTSKVMKMNVDSGISHMESKIKDIENAHSKSSSLSSAFMFKRSLLYARHNLSLLHYKKAYSGRQYLSHFVLCAKERMKVLELGGLVLLDKSVTGPVTGLQQDYMPIDVKNSQCFEHVKLTSNAIYLAGLFKSELKDFVRGKGWAKAALWINRMHVGGDKELFEHVFGTDIKQAEISDFI